MSLTEKRQKRVLHRRQLPIQAGDRPRERGHALLVIARDELGRHAGLLGDLPAQLAHGVRLLAGVRRRLELLDAPALLIELLGAVRRGGLDVLAIRVLRDVLK